MDQIGGIMLPSNTAYVSQQVLILCSSVTAAFESTGGNTFQIFSTEISPYLSKYFVVLDERLSRNPSAAQPYRRCSRFAFCLEMSF